MRGVRRARYGISYTAGYLWSRRPIHPGTRLAVCGIFRDEAPYLAEWIAFHRGQGVDRFYLYDNLSTDEWRSELAFEIESGIVEVIRWPREHKQQFSAYTDCLKRHRTDTRWIAFIDVDEFLFSPTGRSLPAVLRDFEKHPAVVANWRVYGHGGWKTQPPGLVIESYLIRSSDDDPVNRTVKSIVQPRLTRPPIRHPHIFTHYGRAVGEDGIPPDGPYRASTAELLRINHYRTKSVEEWERKLVKGRPDGAWRTGPPGALMPPEHDDVEDGAILPFVPAVKDALRNRVGASSNNGTDA